MSSMTKRASLLMQIVELDATECARCGHQLRRHLPMKLDGTPCRQFDWKQHESGDPAKAKQTFCGCKEFCDTTDEQLRLVK